VSETHLRLSTSLRDLEDDFCPLPLGLIFGKLRTSLDNKPDDFLARQEFGYFLFRAVEAIITVRKHITDFLGLSLDLSFPPSPHIVDSLENFLWCFVYQKRSGIIILFVSHSPSHYASVLNRSSARGETILEPSKDHSPALFVGAGTFRVREASVAKGKQGPIALGLQCDPDQGIGALGSL
jgi:hypothetical protein